jgi:hypothetical protein
LAGGFYDGEFFYPEMLSDISDAEACIEVAAQSGTSRVRMSAALSAQPELPSSSSLAIFSPATSIRPVKSEIARESVRTTPPTNPKLYRPVNGVVGNAFIRLCLWFDLLSSWKKRTYAPPVYGFLNAAATEIETEVVHHPIAS